MALSDARRKANKKWNESNKERVNYLKKRSGAKSFIGNNATDDDIKEFEKLLQERKEILKK